MASIKSVLKKTERVGLTASQSASCVKVKIVNMDIAVVMSVGIFVFHEGGFCKNF